MADYKRILKNVFFIVTVPSVVVVGYYGYKAIQKFRNKDKDIDVEDGGGEEKEVSKDIIEDVERKGEKVVTITK